MSGFKPGSTQPPGVPPMTDNKPAAPGLVEALRSALETARNGLLWYKDHDIMTWDVCDEEAMAEIDAALALSSAPASAPEPGALLRDLAVLRDYFAAKALPVAMDYGRMTTATWPGFEAVAANAYMLADAMLKARNS